jgi:hypothetical protein
MDYSIEEASAQLNIDPDDARAWETDPSWDEITTEARNFNDLDTLRHSARRVVFDGLQGNLKDLPEHTRVELAKWILGRIDHDFQPADLRQKASDETTDKMKDMSTEDLQRIADEKKAEEEEEVVLDV